MPNWVGSAIHAWFTAASVNAGPIFRAINKAGRVAPAGFGPKVIWSVVTAACRDCGLSGVAPMICGGHAPACAMTRAAIEQIQYLLGHESVQTTERYIGCKHRLRNAVNDRIG